MTKLEYLYDCLQEECGEVIVEASKAGRFGLRNNFKQLTPEERLNNEYNDVVAVIELLKAEGVNLNLDQNLIEAKKEKVWRLYNEALEQKVFSKE